MGAGVFPLASVSRHPPGGAEAALACHESSQRADARLVLAPPAFCQMPPYWLTSGARKEPASLGALEV